MPLTPVDAPGGEAVWMKKFLMLPICLGALAASGPLFAQPTTPAPSQGGGLPYGLPALRPPPTPEPPTVNSLYVQYGDAYAENLTGTQVGIGYGIGIARNTSLVFDTHFTRFSQYNFVTVGPEDAIGSLTTGFASWTFFANLKTDITDRDNPVVFYGIGGLGAGLLFNSAVQSNGQSYPADSALCQPFRLGLGMEVRLFKGASLSLEESFLGLFFGSLPIGSGGGYDLGSLGVKVDM